MTDDIAPPDAPSLLDDDKTTPAGSASARPAGRGAKKAGAVKKAVAAKATVKKAAADNDTSPKGPGRPSNDDKLRKSLVDLYVQLGVVVSLVGQPADGQVIGESAAQCADAWVELARVNPAVRRALEGMLKGSAWGGVLMAHFPIILAVAVNHGASVPGIPPAPAAAGPEGNGSHPGP